MTSSRADPNTGPPGRSGPDPSPEEVLRARGHELADAVGAALGPFLARSVLQRATAWTASGHRLADGVTLASVEGWVGEAAASAARVAAAELHALAEADVDAPATTPLAVVRRAAVGAGWVLRRAGVGGLVRDRFETEHFPDDEFGLIPANLRAVDPALGELGLRWGAAKALAHRFRHGPS